MRNKITRQRRPEWMKTSGPYLGKIVNHLDSEYMGSIEVEILKISESGNPEGGSGYFLPCYYVSPFYGVTPREGAKPNEGFAYTQQSYGMWAIPPDVGTKVIVLTLEEKFGFGYWIGCVQDKYMNFMVPGRASTTYNKENNTSPKPVGEYNKTLEEAVGRDPTKYIKPVDDNQSAFLGLQGLLDDTTRGTTTSSARREVPSMVFGMSTPGPHDRREGKPTASYGEQFAQSNVPFSRLGGTTFVMDDGDSMLLRKTPADQGPPEYASVERNEGGDPTLPHNELTRWRTRTGHQILMHNTEDLIYIGNAKGSTWIEMTSNGKIDIFANDSVSIHTSNDLNVTADRDIIMSAGRNICLSAGQDGRITAGQATHISAQTHTESAPGGINMNGPAASPAYGPLRTPQREPWLGHENLDPSLHTPIKTDADPAAGNTAGTGEYVPVPDTFRKGL
jgi:hypothetical protein